jgi:ribonuclease J
MGYADSNVIKLAIGDVLEVEEDNAEVTGSVQSGSVMVDGIGVGDVEDFVLRDRMHLSQDGIVICVVGLDVVSGDLLSGPDVFSRGFAVEEAVDEWLDEAKDLIIAKLDEFEVTDFKESLDEIKTAIRKSVGKLFYEKTRRRPVIVPIIMEI